MGPGRRRRRVWSVWLREVSCVCVFACGGRGRACQAAGGPGVVHDHTSGTGPCRPRRGARSAHAMQLGSARGWARSARCTHRLPGKTENLHAQARLLTRRGSAL